MGKNGVDYTGLATLVGAFAAFFVAVWGAVRPRPQTAEQKASDAAFDVLSGTLELLEDDIAGLRADVRECKQQHKQCEADRDKDRRELNHLTELVHRLLEARER